MSGFEVLDPRHHPAPPYWADLRRRAGLRADWAWDVLTAQSWSSPSRRLVVVEHGRDHPTGVLAASWVTWRTRPHRSVATGRGGRLGLLHVHSPGSSAVPGWWFEDDPAAGLRQRLDGCLRQLRRELGAGCRGALLRQVAVADLAALRGRCRLVRRTEDVATMDLTGVRDLEHWLNGLGRNRRRYLRRIGRRLDADQTLRVRTGPAAAADPLQVAELLWHNARKYGGRFAPPPMTTGYLERILRQPDVFATTYTSDATGDLLAVGLHLDHPRRPTDWKWAALPVELGGRSNLYFHGHLAVVRWALAAGRDGLVLGKGKPELKRTLGGDLVPQYAVAAPLW